jgi:hypothetical protein
MKERVNEGGYWRQYDKDANCGHPWGGEDNALPFFKDDYDWYRALIVSDIRPADPTDQTISLASFCTAEIASILVSVEGENDGDYWMMIGTLKDGRWFFLSAGCDYTGWDCQAGGTVFVAPDEGTLMQFGVSAQEFLRLFGVPRDRTW